MSHSRPQKLEMNVKISNFWKIMIFSNFNIFNYVIFAVKKTLKKMTKIFSIDVSSRKRKKKSENEKWFAQHLQFSRFENFEIPKNHRKKHILVIGDCIVFTSKSSKIASFDFHQPPVPRRASPRAFWRKRRARRLRFECTSRNIISITFKACRSV